MVDLIKINGKLVRTLENVIDAYEQTTPSTLEDAIERARVVLWGTPEQRGEHFPLGIVLEPNADFSAEDVRKTCHNFNSQFENVGLMTGPTDTPGDDDEDEGPAVVTDGSKHVPRSTDEPFAQPLRYGIDWDDIPQYPNYPACKLTCVDCDGEPHHWFSEYIDFAATNPDHPAAKAGHEVWQVCKHCPAWRLMPDGCDDLNPVTCEHLKLVKKGE